MYRSTSPSVVLVEVTTSEGHSQGSGVVVGDRQIATNAHVIRGARGPITIRQGDSVWRAEVENVDEEHDLAILGVVLRRNEQFSLPAVRRRTTSTLTVGERVYAIGAPRGLERTLSDGLISGIPARGDNAVIQTSAAISPGSSGGGLFDDQGRLVGITTQTYRDSQNLNFVVSADYVGKLQRLPAHSVSTAPIATSGLRDTSSNCSSSRPELPSALSTIGAVIVMADTAGPVATAGGMTEQWLRGHVTARLRNHGIWVYGSREQARADERLERRSA